MPLCYNGADMTDEENPKLVAAREAIRLSEARLDVQQADVSAVERKAALLGTLCIAIIGYLLTPDEQTTKCLQEFIKGERCSPWLLVVSFVFEVIASSIFAVGLVFCWKTLIPKKYQWKGVTLSTMPGDPFRDDLVGMLKTLAGGYDKAFIKNDRTIKKKKLKNIKKAIRCGQLGVMFAFVSAMVEKIAVLFPIDCLIG